MTGPDSVGRRLQSCSNAAYIALSNGCPKGAHHLMSTASRRTIEPENLGWLLTSFVRRVPDVAHALAVSVDGLTLAASEGLPPDRADQLSAITSGLASLTIGAANFLSTGRVRQTIVDMDAGVLLVVAVGDRAQLAVLGVEGADLGQIGYETALLVHRVASALEPGARVAGQL